MAANEPKKALKILPMEVWCMILNDIDDPEDKIRLLNAAKDVKKRTRASQGAGWMLEKVITLPVFQEWAGLVGSLNKLKLCSSKYKENLENNLYDLRRLKEWHLTDEDAQQTSISEWKSSQHPFKFKSRDPDGANYGWAKVRGDIVLENLMVLQEWFQKRKQDDRLISPFPINSLLIRFDDDQLSRNDEHILENVHPLLWQPLINNLQEANFRRMVRIIRRIIQKFGVHVHYFKIVCPNLKLPSSIERFGTMLFRMLPWMPNLKELAFVGGDIAFLGRNAFPVAPRNVIHSLSITGLPNPFTTELINTLAPRAKKLILDIRLVRMSIAVRAPVEFATRELVLLNDCVDGAGYHFYLLKQAFLSNQFPNLIKLVVDLVYFNPIHVLQILHNFPRLSYLEMVEHPKISTFNIRSANIRNFRQFPQIRFLVIPFHQSINYDFLELFQLVDEMKFVSRTLRPATWIPHAHLRNSARFPQLQEMLTNGDIQASNLWLLLPTLKTVYIDWKGIEEKFKRP